MKRKTLVGVKFGKLLVIEKLQPDIKDGVRNYWYKCQCDCGKIVNKRSSNLRKDTKGCSCEKGTYNKIDENGKQFGFLKVLGPSENKHHSSMLWKCECICGSIKDYKGNCLRRGLVKSCGCKRSSFVSESLTKPTESVGLNRIYDAYKRGAEVRNYIFNLTKEQFYSFLHKECYYCGDLNTNTHKLRNREFKYNGIDRVINTIGYSMENCVTCCKVCNEMKMTRTQKEFLDHIRKINEKTQSNI